MTRSNHFLTFIYETSSRSHQICYTRLGRQPEPCPLCRYKIRGPDFHARLVSVRRSNQSTAFSCSSLRMAFSDSTSHQSETRNRQTQDTLHAVRSHARRSLALKIASALFLRRPSEGYCAYRLCKPRFDLTVLIIHLPYLYNQKRTDAAKISPPFVNGRTTYSVPAV